MQLLLESAVLSEGPERAKALVINHVNKRGHSALMLACMHGCARLFFCSVAACCCVCAVLVFVH